MTPLDEIRKVYASLPTLDCQGWCWHSCGPIDMSTAERNRLTELGATIEPFSQERARRWSENERLYCSALSLGARGMGKPGCTVYEDRPLICRLWGMTDSMQCDFGCEPSRRLSEAEAFALVFQVMRLGGSDLTTGRPAGELDQIEQDFMAMMDNEQDAAAVRRFIVSGDPEARREAHAVIERNQR